MKLFNRAAIVLGCLMMLSAGTSLFAQDSVHFENISFEQATVKAKKYNKIVFVDVQGMKEGPANVQVDKEIFTADSVVRYFNQHCVSIKMNMSTEEGKKFAPRLAMLMYPVYVFHDANGDQLDFTNAGLVLKEPGVLMDKARRSLATADLKRANKRSITFTENKWDAILAKAKKENKLVFLDAYTQWCRPCIMMAKDVFTLDTVADFYNKNFINVSMDMEKGEGPAIAKQYKITAYPTFLYVDGDGKLVSRDGGYQEADKFIQAGETAVGKKNGTAQASSFIRPMRLTAPSAAGAAAKPAKEEVATPTAIHFSDSTWKGMLAEAKRTGKLIFVDAHTTWCGPCKLMRANVFTQSKVGTLYNNNFVNAYIDMEKGEGLDIRKQYEVHYYPTFLYINGDGEVVHKTVGSCTAEEFMQHGLDAISPFNNLQFLQKEYAKKPTDPVVVTNYLKALANAYEQDQTNKVANTYLQTLEPASWLQRDNWTLIESYLKDASSPVFQYVVDHEKSFANAYGDAVEAKIYSTYLSWPISYMTFAKDTKPVFDEKGYNQFISQVTKSKYEKKNEVIGRANATIYMANRDWDNYTKTVSAMVTDHLVPMDKNGAELLYGYANNVNMFAADNLKAQQAACGWVKISCEDVPEVASLDKATYMDLYATLLEKTKQDKLAKEVRKKIDQDKLSEAKSTAAFQPLMRMAPKAKTDTAK